MKKIKKSRESSVKSSKLEALYRRYLVPMTLEQWASTASLEQPSFLKQVPTRTVYSTTE